MKKESSESEIKPDPGPSVRVTREQPTNIHGYVIFPDGNKPMPAHQQDEEKVTHKK